jgi:cobalt-zinc-cadmium efflux system outer membrane protein
MKSLSVCHTTLMVLFIMPLGTSHSASDQTARFEAPFDTTAVAKPNGPLTLPQVISRVARSNPEFEALRLQRNAAAFNVHQAGLGPNPEFESEFENIGGDASGFGEAEITLLLSQEFQIFGQRGARARLAQSELDAVSLQTRLAAFDLFLEVKRRFYALAHAQKRVVLAHSSIELARDILDNITYRLEKGAALKSELLLAELELARKELARDAAMQEQGAGQAQLSALWNFASEDVQVAVSDEPQIHWNESIAEALTQATDSSRISLQIMQRSRQVLAEQSLVSAEAKPGITLSGGYKRLQESGTNSFVFGVSFPLPLFNRDQGTHASLDASLQSLEFQKARAQTETRAAIRAGSAKLSQLINQHYALDTRLLPTAEKAYETLQDAYKAGRLPYTNLLEAERSLIEIRFEHNDVLLAIHRQVITLERITGIILQEGVSKGNHP